MIILHAAAIAWHRIAGPSISIPGLVAAQNRGDNDVQAALLVTYPNSGNTPEVDYPVFGLNTLKSDQGLHGLPTPFDRPDLVVLHSTYYPRHARIARGLVRDGIPYLLCPRGGMTRESQNLKRWKKWIGNILFFNRLVARAEALHCLSAREADASGYWSRPIFVVGNGIPIPDKACMAKPGSSQTRRFLFLGRLLIRHKGLDLLLDACTRVRSTFEEHDATIDLFGPDHEGSVAWLNHRIHQLGLKRIVKLRGPIVGHEKQRVFLSADIFLHPSRSEGHPMAVLEAISHGLPCLLTPGSGMAEEVADAGAGWNIEPTPEGIAAGLLEGLFATPEHLAEAGARARRLAVEHYTWDRVANDASNAYRKYAA